MPLISPMKVPRMPKAVSMLGIWEVTRCQVFISSTYTLMTSLTSYREREDYRDRLRIFSLKSLNRLSRVSFMNRPLACTTVSHMLSG